ncbi:GNAT family N-acetyltransferase [Hymenobacter lutimineralis]|uniref:GNAT family N-acetyltransferase n=1 Tax=Hymenobacter lutimineralis TaxID=2606448 RepID=A0A5D6VCZ6_9BACT|nr:GNAT family N-acetyltransferase [Hymenobacter lutimineralis]TYZ13386.1 GNAT family N-acetyltransferase [Hymenobacter lutimineralis]
MPTYQHPSNGFTISTDPERLDVDAIHRYLAEDSYWAQQMPRETLERALAHSLNFGLFAPDGRQAGFARLITDHATFAWLCDVFVLPEFRGQGLSKWLMEVVWAAPEIQGVRRSMLATLDAHGLYHQFGFQPLASPERYLEIKRQNPYGAPTAN